MQIESLTQNLPDFKELVTPVLIAVFFWLLKSVGPPIIHRLGHLLRLSRPKELKRVQKIRVDPFAIQRQIVKEGAFFCAFLVVTLASFGIVLHSFLNNPSLKIPSLRFIMYMTPILVLEICWLWQREFVNTLLEESSRIGPNFTRYLPARTQSDTRIAKRESRRALLAKRTKPSKKQVGRRLV